MIKTPTQKFLMFFADVEVGVMEIIGDSSNQQLDNRFDLLGHSLETA